jgi:hypothetical protein
MQNIAILNQNLKRKKKKEKKIMNEMKANGILKVFLIMKKIKRI